MAKTSLVVGGDQATMAGSPVLPGDIVAGKYRMGAVIGFAGRGTVREGVHLDLEIQVAVMFARPEDAQDEGAVARLLSGARSAAQLRSQHVRRVLDCGRLEGGSPYVVLEYLEGSDLRSVLTAHGSLPVEEAVSLTLQACEALGEAHSRGMVHGDVKAENLFLTRGPDGGALIKVLDLGTSSLHLSPEQLSDPTAVDARTDIWSLGVLLYELLTGELPFEGNSVSEGQAKMTAAQPRSPRDLDPAISKGIAAVALRCLEKDPDARFPDAATLGHALRAFGGSISSINAARVEDMLRHARSIRPSVPVAPPSSSPPSSRDSAEELVRASWLMDPPAAPPSSRDSAEEAVRASWPTDPPAAEAVPSSRPDPVSSRESPASSPSLVATPPPIPTALQSIPAPPPLPASSQSAPAGPLSRRIGPPRLPLSNVARLATTLRLPTALRLATTLRLPKTQRARVALGGLLGGLMIAVFFWPGKQNPAAEPTTVAPAVSTAARTVAPVQPVPLPSASPAPPPSHVPALAPMPSSEPARVASAPPRKPTRSTTPTTPTTPSTKPSARPVPSRASSLYPEPKPLSL